MRICFVSHSTSHFTIPYVDYFAKQGHEVHVVSLFPGDVPNAVNHHPLPRFSEPGLRTLTYSRAIRPVRKMLRFIDPCIVHAHYLTSNGLVAALAGCRPLIVSARGSDLHRMWNPLRRAAVSYAVRHADLVNPVSHHQHELLLALGAPASKVLTLSQGVESDQFMHDRSRHDAGPVRLLCTRRLEATYNCVAILRALSILKDQGVAFHCTFAAGGPQEPHLKREASALGVVGHVTFLGGYCQDELPRLLEDADVYVSAKPTDGASVSLLEAMASGVFPVVTDIPGNREWLTGKGDSLLFRRGNVRELAAGLRIAIENAHLRYDAVDVNRRRVQLYGERRKNLARLAVVYEELIGTYKRA